MELEEWQLDIAQIAIVNESGCNDRILEILAPLGTYAEALEAIESYVYANCDAYLQDLLTEEQRDDDEEFECNRTESTEIAQVVLLHFGWTPETFPDSKPEFSTAAAVNFIISNDKESKEIAEGLEEFKAGNKASCKTFTEWLQVHIHGGMDSFFTKCFGIKISTTEVEAQDIVLGLLAYFPDPTPKSPEQLQEEINEHVNKASAILQHVENQIARDPDLDHEDAEVRVKAQLKQYKENIMAQTVTVETIHYVNGNDVKQMSRDQLHNCMKELEDEIESLKQVKVKSKSITLAKKEAKVTLAVVVKHADAKVK